MLRAFDDLWPLTMVALGLGLALTPFFLPMPLWLLVPFLAAAYYVRSFAPYAQHNHGHLPMFRWKPLNHLYDLVLTQLTGYPTALWELHHNRGHHRHYLTPEKDVAGIILPGTGRPMSRWRYALGGNLGVYQDSIRIGLEEGRAGKKTLLPKLFGEAAAQLAILVALFWWQPLLALFCCLLPQLFAAFFIWWESYNHHLEMPATSTYDASVTILNPRYNWLAFNIGHHTAHHERPTLHWSQLPARTQAIRDRLPEQCVLDRYFHSSRRQLEETRSRAGAQDATPMRAATFSPQRMLPSTQG